MQPALGNPNTGSHFTHFIIELKLQISLSHRSPTLLIITFLRWLHSRKPLGCTRTGRRVRIKSHQMIHHHYPSAFFLNLCNRLWVEGVFTLVWSTALIVSIPKPGKDMTQATNHRHSSLTCHICKIMERIVANHFIFVVDERVPQGSIHGESFCTGT